MKKHLPTQEIIEVAFGDLDYPDLEPDTLAEVKRYNKIRKAMATRLEHAPAELVSQAKAIFVPAIKRRLFARLAASSLAFSGARSESAESFQLSFEVEEFETRLMYAREGASWTVIGRAPGEGWSMSRGKKTAHCEPDGTFEFKAKDLQDTSLVLTRGNLELEIPSAKDATAYGSQSGS